MKSLFFTLVMGIGFLALAVGCGDSTEQEAKKEDGSKEIKVGKFVQTTLENGEPSHITVQHLLIAFEGSVSGKEISRTKEEAEELAKQLFEEIKAGGDFDFLVKTKTDDAYPGIYHMANFEQKFDLNTTMESYRVFPRADMVAAFGDVGFPMKVGEFGLAEYDTEKSKYGWHIIKRLQ